MKLLDQKKESTSNRLIQHSDNTYKRFVSTESAPQSKSEFNCTKPDEIGGFYQLFQNPSIFFQTYGHRDNPLLASGFE